MAMATHTARKAISETRCCESQTSMCVWCTVFTLPPFRKGEIPYIDAGEIDTTEDIARDESPLEFFMLDDQEPLNCRLRASKVESFCEGASLEPRINPDGTENAPLVVWIDDCSNDGHHSVPRRNRGLLTAVGFSNYLLKHPRFRQPEDNPKADSELAQDQGPEEEQEPEADRRLLFISNPDCQSILALVTMAGKTVAEPVRNSLYNHLMFQSFMIASVLWNGYPVFQLAFDLPCYVLCESTFPVEDVPRKVNGERLRTCEDLSFLAVTGTDQSNERYYLCQAHVSCVVTGRSNCIWEAHMFADTYSGLWEDFEDYDYDSEDPDHGHQDPLRAGMAADIPILDPRCYFLNVFKVRSKQANAQWRHLLDMMRPWIEGCIEFYSRPMCTGSDQPASPIDLQQSYTKQLELTHDWVTKANRLLRKLQRTLSSTSEKWTSFNCAYFDTMDYRNRGVLQMIRDTFSQFGDMSREFGELIICCENLEKEGISHLQHLQSKIAAHSTTLLESQITAADKAAKRAHELSEEHHKTAKQTHKIQEGGKSTTAAELTVALVMLAAQIVSIPKDSNLVPISGQFFTALVAIVLAIFYAINHLVHNKRWWKQLKQKLLGFCKYCIAFICNRVGAGVARPGGESLNLETGTLGNNSSIS